jgi:mRNA interferase RelE/StbE
MIYEIEFMPRAVKDMAAISKSTARRLFEKIELLSSDLSGDVKRLTSFTPEYRLRVGDYRVLFEVVAGKVIIHRVKHRSDAYNP